MRSQPLALALLAGILSIPVGLAAPSGIDFELARIDGSGFWELSAQEARLSVINVWSPECAPCIREMPLLDRAAGALRQVRFVGINSDTQRQGLAFLSSHPLGYLQLQAPTDPFGLLRRLGNHSGALPFTVVLRKDRSLCTQKTGEIDARWLSAALNSCQ